MFNQILSASPNYVPLIILAVFFVLMIVMTIVPQRKRQKQTQQMMDNLAVGDKVMTIGRMIGKITNIDSDNNQITLNVGTDDSETLVVIDRNAIGFVIDGKYKPEEKTKKENKGIKSKKEEKVEDDVAKEADTIDTPEVETVEAKDAEVVETDNEDAKN